MLFQRRKTKVRIVDQWEKSEEKYAPGVLISVSNGQGLLYDMIKEIVSMNADGKLTDYFIDVMVEYEDDYPEIKDLLLDYIW